ncbi:MAG: YcxB family protein [Oscillospiraceae bacterium]|nr:YcxB family protein [Oscillospiraceae bacterium]MBR4194487.1 YcxB family protein [Oscillospiraceae bacterium]
MGSANKEQFKGIFVYTEEVLNDFEAMYRMKTAVSPATRLVLGLIGAAGMLVFLVLMLLKGFSVGFLVPMVLFALILLLAFAVGRKKADSSVERYRKHYLNKKVHVQVDDNGVELKINGQKSFARSRFKDVYSLLETDKTFFMEVKGRAFYILPKDGMDCSAEALKNFVQKKCGKRFVKYDVQH